MASTNIVVYEREAAGGRIGRSRLRREVHPFEDFASTGQRDTRPPRDLREGPHILRGCRRESGSNPAGRTPLEADSATEIAEDPTHLG
jgi:hypothetical protein